MSETRKTKLTPRDQAPVPDPPTPAQEAAKAASQKHASRTLSPLARTRTGQRVIKPLRPAHTEYR